MSEPLFEKLTSYREKGPYPFCMPGHHRSPDCGYPDLYGLDITEVEGFDNLHQPTGILKDLSDRAAAAYGCRYAFLSVNGSTAGTLAAMTAAPAGTALVARNCHKSLQDGADLRRFPVKYLYPEHLSRPAIFGGLDPSKVEAALADDPEISVVAITSPTYDGFVSDIPRIAAAAHAHGAILVVDEAHGAHFPFGKCFPEEALQQGADIAVVSLHKTLPALNQTALVLVNDDALAARVERRMDAFVTTSPSYLLLSSIDQCLRLTDRLDFDLYARRLKAFRKNVCGLQHIRIPGEELSGSAGISAIDPGKLIILPDRDSGICGKLLLDYLLFCHGLQLEMAGLDYALAMTSVMDGDAAFSCLADALKEADRLADKGGAGALEQAIRKQVPGQTGLPGSTVKTDLSEIPLGEPYGAYIYVYPPGSPVIAPGEIFTEEIRDYVQECLWQGLEVLFREKIC